ncbi:hypothetical protein B0T18DRAFT_482356 [Schizothecium vesticola]|uniref:ferroxidase n=1 Tax=Schizothecium vesticola TaxID=314040 RepID=A0AA40JYW6_9PEZI|nr:hypothetical protein B0T18DRAFT_482356 [Schizothecium vesticola]
MMARQNLIRTARSASRALQATRNVGVAGLGPARLPLSRPTFIPTTPRPFTTSTPRLGITPDDTPPKNVETPDLVRTAAVITDAEYHAVADEFMDRLLSHLEGLEEKTEDLDVEYSAGVLNIRFGPEIGTYVVNKQPPNKQIWLSSPKSGPKRYDYVIMGDGQHEKQDTAVGDWLYLRDNSSLTELFREELGIELGMPADEFGTEV